MKKVYIVMGRTNDYEATHIWIHSAHLNNITAVAARNKMEAFLADLPNGGKQLESDSSDKRVTWMDYCEKKLLKIDKKSRFYMFGASYFIETINLVED